MAFGASDDDLGIDPAFTPGRRSVARLHAVQEAAQLAHAFDFISEFRAGFDTFAGWQGSQLSGGQRQRVAIARALLRRPRVLLVDEGTSALDARTEAGVQSQLEAAMRGRTMVVIAHRLSTVRNADHIICMSAGRVAEQGTHEELLALGGVYADLVAKQLVSDA